MEYHGTNDSFESIALNTLVSIKNYYNIIVERSNLTFRDHNLHSISIDEENSQIADMYHFAEKAEYLLKTHPDSAYTVITFDIDNFREINNTYGYEAGNDLLEHIRTVLQDHVQQPNLYCRMHDDNFALLLENCREIDIALLVIQLTEEINNYNDSLQIKLSFGTCKADSIECNIPYLCTRAYYAKSTIKGMRQHLLANFDDVIYSKQAI